MNKLSLLKKIIKIVILIMSVFSIIWIGCIPPVSGSSGSGSGGGSDENTNITYGEDTSVILPLEIGNTWTHDNVTSHGTSSETLTVVSVSNIGGIDVYRTNYSTGAYEYLGNHIGNGLYFYGDNTTGYIIPPYLFLQYSCSVGDSWTFDRYGGTYTVQDISDVITVPAGSFECIVYYYRRSTASGLTEHYEYWAPGIGLVQNNVYLDHSLIVSIRLRNYTLF